MLFTTAAFAFLFLPCAVIGFFLIARRSYALAAVWLFAASVFFYGYWMPRFTLLLLASVSVNFLVGRRKCTVTLRPQACRRSCLHRMRISMELPSPRSRAKWRPPSRPVSIEAAGCAGAQRLVVAPCAAESGCAAPAADSAAAIFMRNPGSG